MHDHIDSFNVTLSISGLSALDLPGGPIKTVPSVISCSLKKKLMHSDE